MKIKYTYIIGLLLVWLITSCSVTEEVAASAVQEQIEQRDLFSLLKEIPEVAEVKKLKVEDHFTEHYEVWFEQHIDPNDDSSPTFRQRVLIAHVSDDAPVIVELQGYRIHTRRSGELATLFKGNQITIEHRFFEDSRPKGELPWKTLTVENAAADQHKVIVALKRAIYPKNKFITTGISKGGQTTMIHRTHYPDDVDASVCYVAPLNFEREDPRIWNFLETVGTKEQREQIRTFQIACFKRKKELLKALDKRIEEDNYAWDFSPEVALDYYILEYSFAFWQWGAYTFDQIPSGSAPAEELLEHVLSVSGVSFFEKSGVQRQRPFFYAAMTQMGMYDYDPRPFQEYLEQETYNFEFTFPRGEDTSFDPAPMKKVNAFIQEKAEKMMFIYGEVDTWSATAVNLSESAINRGLKKHVLKNGSHGTRIRHFSKNDQQEIISTLEEWIGTEVAN